MKIALVAMPWAHFDAPSSGLGALSAWLHQHRPQHEVSCAHPFVDMWLRSGGIYEPVCGDIRAELLFLPLLFPSSRDAVRQRFGELLDTVRAKGAHVPTDEHRLFDGVLQVARGLVEELVDDLCDSFDLVGLTVVYSQLFSSLTLARALKARNPALRIVLGGGAVEGACGRSTLKLFDCVDHVVLGEGELAFTALLDALEAGEPTEGIPGVLSRGQHQTPFDGPLRLANEIQDLDTLPIPDYSDYAALADEHNIFWHLPLESSRGCWWNRRLKTGDPRHACYFCNINSGSYREKGPARVGSEVSALVQRYQNVRLRFMDSAMRHHGLADMLQEMRRQQRDLRFVTEVRASIDPHELLLLWETGCHHVQIGIEGLSSAYLRRIGKGATTIQNLQTMKTCFELGMHSASNLLTHFPGTPQEEVDEMTRNVLEFASGYEPTHLSHFALLRGSTVELIPEAFGVSNLRGFSTIARCLPEPQRSGLDLFRLDFNGPPQADWAPLEQAVATWKELHAQVPLDRTFSDKPLYYLDGGGFLEIIDRRQGFRTITLVDHWYALYMACMRIQRTDALLETLGQRYPREELLPALEAMTAERIMFHEGERWLSLAPAATPQAAVRRIRGGWPE